jgi:hypothetical protein
MWRRLEISMSNDRNIQSGVPVAESAGDAVPQVASAAERGGAHYEPDPDQGVKAVHQIKPDAIPVATPTDYEQRGGPQPETVTDIRVTPSQASVHEARPLDD